MRWFDRILDPRVVDLLVYKTYADLRAEAARTYISYLWWVIDPILTMLVFYVVFGLLFSRGGEGFVAFLLVGLVVWNWYRQTISHAGNAILIGQGLMNQVHVPKIVFPVVVFLTDLTKFAVVFALLLAFLWLSGYPIGAAYWALPVLLVTQGLLVAALALLMAALVPYLPDLRLLVDNLLHLQFFLSGIFYAVGDIPVAYQGYFYLNPMASLIDDYRLVLLEGQWPHWGRLSLILFAAAGLLALAVSLLRWRDRDYPRILA